MNINLNKNLQEKTRTLQQGGTIISPNLRKQTVTIDKDGNEIDPRTKQIIKRNIESKN